MHNNWPAISQQRAFLTHDRVDFEAQARTYFDEDKAHYGIIIAVRYPAYELTRRLLIILNSGTADELVNQLRYI